MSRTTMRLEPLERRLSFSAAAMGLIGIDLIRADPLLSPYDGTGATIVVIDQPIDWEAAALTQRRVTDIDLLGSAGPVNGENHGTFVASIIAAESSGIGVAPGAGLIGVLSDGTPPPVGTNPSEVWRLDENDIEDILQWVLEHREQHNIVAVNMSLGDGRFYTSPDQVAQRVLNDEIALLEQAGVVVVSAAGNDYPEDQTRNTAYPAIVSTLAVGAVYAENVGPQVASGDNTTGPDRIAAFSQRPPAGTANGLFAPGAAVRGILSQFTQGSGSGTSFAAPYVSGAVAILQHAAMAMSGSRMSVGTVIDILMDTADTIVDGDDEDDNVANTGASLPRLNVYEALQEVYGRYAQPNVMVLGGSRLDQPVEHEVKAKRSNGTGFGPIERDGAHKDAVFFIRNTGVEPLIITGAEIRGQSPEHFTITLAPSSPVVPGGTVAIVVRFDPSVYGTVRANIAVFSNDPDRRRFTAKVAGVGMPPESAADIAVTGGAGDIRDGDRRARSNTGTRFGMASALAPVEREFTISNDGGSSLTLSPGLFSVEGANPADFAIVVMPSQGVLAPGETTTFTVRFLPTGGGVRKADIVVMSDDPDESPFTFRVIGTGV